MRIPLAAFGPMGAIGSLLERRRRWRSLLLSSLQYAVKVTLTYNNLLSGMALVMRHASSGHGCVGLWVGRLVGGVLLLNSNRLNGRFIVSTRHGNRCVVTYSSCTKTPTVRITSRYRMFDVLSKSTLRHMMHGRRPSVVIPRVRTVHARHLCSFRGRNVRMIPDTHTIGFAVGHGTVHSLTTGRLKLGATGCFCTGSLSRLGTTTRGVNFPYIIGPLVSSSNGNRSLMGDTSRLRRT